MKQEIKNHWQTWIFCVALGIVLIITYKAIDSIGTIAMFLKGLMSVLTPFLVGILISYLLYIPESKLEKMFKNSKSRIVIKNARKLGILFTYILAILIVILLINVILPILVESIDELIGNVQIYYTKIIGYYNDLPNDSIFKTEQVYDTLKQLQNVDLKQYVSIDKITGYIKGAVGVARGIFDIFVAVIVSVYILSQRNEIFGFFQRFSKATFKEETYNYLGRIFKKANIIFFKFISSQFVDAIVIGILSTIALSIMKVKYAALLGFTIGLFNMIPYFGAIIAIAFAALITFLTGGFSKAVVMLIVIIILQQIDANVINPKIIGESLKISPLLVIIAVTIGGAYFGIVGMFLAVPITGVLKIMVNDYIDNRLN